MPTFPLRAAAVAPLAVFLLTGEAGSAPPDGVNPRAETGAAADRLFTDFTPETFRASERARRPIDMERPDYDALAAAIFHETNRRRAREKRPPLRHDAKARRAARTQAELMAETNTLTHVHPGKSGRRTLMDRLHLAGARPSWAAENIATAFALNYRPGEQIHTRKEKGKTLFSRKPGGAPIPAHTPVTFAEALLDSWMNSPGHRRNILSKEPRRLGTGLRPAKRNGGIPVFYCAQVFYAPFE